MRDMQRDLKPSFMVLLTLPATAMGFALSVQIAVLSVLLSTKYGLEIHEIGLVWAAGPLAGIFGQVIIGLISDEAWFWGGRRRPFILIGGVLAALALLALPSLGLIANALGLESVLGVAIVVALGLDLSINVSFNPARSIIADVTPEGRIRTKGYTWMQTVSGTVSLFAYLIGAVMGNLALIYIGAALVLVLSIFPVFAIEEPRSLTPAQDGVEPEKTPLMENLGSIALLLLPLWALIVYCIYAMGLKIAGIEQTSFMPEYICFGVTMLLMGYTLLAKDRGREFLKEDLVEFRKLMVGHAFSWVGVQTMFVYIFAFIQERLPGLTDKELGSVIAISFLILNAVAALLPAFVLQPLTDRWGRVRVHAACLASMALSYGAIVLFAHSAMSLYVLMAFVGIGWSAIVSLPFAMMSLRVKQARMGLYMGLFNLSVVLPQLLVSLGVGLFVSRAPDKGVVFMISAVSLALASVAWLGVRRMGVESAGAEMAA